MPQPTTPKPRKKRKLTVAAEWYDAHLANHRRLAQKLKSLFEELLSSERLEFDRVDVRVKTRNSFLEKAAKRISGRSKYSAPTEQIKDLVGVRIITFLDSTVVEVGALISREFDVDISNSLDKDMALGTDRVGYRSKHYVSRFSKKRADLAEYTDFATIAFEIQVRSLLQHAWAEMEHDRRFKYPGELPADIKRRFSLLAGQLEAADREFNHLALEVDGRALRTAREASGADAGESLTIVNAAAYLRGIFAEHIPSGLVEPGLGGGGGNELLGDLLRFDINTLGGLADLLPHDFTARFPEVLGEQTTFVGLVRDAMMFKDAVRYFGKVWSKRQWGVMGQSEIEMFEKHGVDIAPLLKAYNILRDVDLLEDNEEECPGTEMGECSFCGRPAPEAELSPIGAGGQDAPLACPKCVHEIDDGDRQE